VKTPCFFGAGIGVGTGVGTGFGVGFGVGVGVGTGVGVTVVTGVWVMPLESAFTAVCCVNDCDEVSCAEAILGCPGIAEGTAPVLLKNA
jgi:hypothetical protein